jgi:RNA polymerase sigma-70 factor (ECF subfamily)
MTDLEPYRIGLTGYCYRMLGAALEAEDAVQETFLRALRTKFEPDRGSLKNWLYSIATNICLDMLRSAQRRAVVMDLAEPSAPGTPLGVPLPGTAWVHPMPDNRILDPADHAVTTESIRLAFVAALQHLPAKQRAVLILREVLCWKADEVAKLLDTTSASVNSALQRARATMATQPSLTPLETDHADLVDRYMKAFQNYDIEALVALLHEDATMTMPPFAWWLRGRDQIRATILGAGSEAVCRSTTYVPAGLANGSPAFGQYLPSGPFALFVLSVSGGLVTETTTYLGAELFPLFGLDR